MHDAACARAAALLIAHRDAGTRIAQLPPDCRPSSRAEGYAIQAKWGPTKRSPLFGWKIAATSAAGQRHINVDGPLAGRLFAERVLPAGATASLTTSLMRAAEIELAFRMGHDLPPRASPYGVDEVIAAADTLHPAIEIPDSRYEDFCAVGAPQLIADNACADRFVLGAAAPVPWRELDLAAHAVIGEIAGKSRHEGTGANVLGDPRVALAWIANELSALGIGLRAGEVVTTGTCVAPIPVAPGDELRASYGVLGSLSVRFD